MAILRLLLRRRTPCHIRLMAFANVLAFCFVVTMTLLTTLLALFVLIPRVCSDSASWFHQCAIVYLFLNVSGNFYLCMTTDTSAECLRLDSSDKPKRHSSGTCGQEQACRDNKIRETDEDHCETLSKSSTTRSEEMEPSDTDCLDHDEVSRSHVPEPSKVSLASAKSRNKFGASKSREVDSSGASGRTKAELATATSIARPRRPTPASASVLEYSLDRSQREVNCREPSIANPVSLPADNGLYASKCLAEHDVSVTRSTAEPGTAPDTKPAEGRERHQPSDDLQSELTSLTVAVETAGRGVKRSHFCKLCEKTILKRDHHCFFMTTCVGYYNQKHFIFFCFYMMLGAFYGLVLVARFLHVRYDVEFHGPQTFFLLLKDVAMGIWQKGHAPPTAFCLLLYELYVCLGVTLVAGGLLYWQICITVAGQTTYEMMNGDKRYSSTSVSKNLRDVLGRYWPALFFLPLPLPQVGNGRYSSAGQGAEGNTCPGQQKDAFANRGRQVLEKRKREKCQKVVRKTFPKSEQNERFLQQARRKGNRKK